MNDEAVCRVCDGERDDPCDEHIASNHYRIHVQERGEAKDFIRANCQHSHRFDPVQPDTRPSEVE